MPCEASGDDRGRHGLDPRPQQRGARSVHKQAMDLGAYFEPRERENITGVFLNLASVGL